jgi:peroxiredoxin
MNYIILPLAAALVLVGPFAARADDETLAGHSLHGDAFNEGPRQKAYLMDGTGKVSFPISTVSAQAQKFFNQGVGQLHGFWYFEAERSFRQVAALDTNCAAAYWGMAMANVNNLKRGGEFIKVATKLKAKATQREGLWIDALATYYNRDDKKKDDKERRRQYVLDLEKISKSYPQDIEAKAFLALQLWDNSSKGIAITNRAKVDALLNEVLASEPMHPVHHYRIHLWNNQNDRLALNSAASCGQSSTDIAHMWHMPGHTFSKLNRYSDAAWQQEAAARVDHWNMIHDRVLPDQIHNYAHNNEWLIRDLSFIGQVRHGIDLAKNLIELPRHPKFNHLAKNGSASYGRERLLDLLVRYELWDDLIGFSQTIYLEPTEQPDDQARRLRALGVAYFSKGDATHGRQQLASLELLSKPAPKPAPRTPASPKAAPAKRTASLCDDDDEKPAATNSVTTTNAAGLRRNLTLLTNALAELRGWDALAAGQNAAARTEFEKAKDISKERLSQIYWRLGDKPKAIQTARDALKGATNQVQVLANYADLLYRDEQYRPAFDAFLDLKRISGQIDLDIPVFQRLQPLAQTLKLPADWRDAPPKPTDVGKRPDLNKLGPFRWHPAPAPDFTLTDSDGKSLSLRKYRGKPVVVIFYLGHGCQHCVLQLSAFAPIAKDFAAAGISLVAVSTDSVEGLQKTFEKTGQAGALPFPLVSDKSLKTFKSFRAFDDFENMPLHGTFLIDGAGLIRWQDISYQPFTETKFLLTEAKRLLSLPRDREDGRGRVSKIEMGLREPVLVAGKTASPSDHDSRSTILVPGLGSQSPQRASTGEPTRRFHFGDTP